SGVFPSGARSCSSALCRPGLAAAVFGVGFRRVGGKPPGRIPSLYPRGANPPRLALKPFRRERAISRFDETFTPPHGSSPSFSTLVGSALHGPLRPLQPAH